MKFVVKFWANQSETQSGSFDTFEDAQKKVSELCESEAEYAWVEVEGYPELRTESSWRKFVDEAVVELEVEDFDIQAASALHSFAPEIAKAEIKNWDEVLAATPEWYEGEPQKIEAAPEALEKISELVANPPEPTEHLVDVLKSSLEDKPRKRTKK